MVSCVWRIANYCVETVLRPTVATRKSSEIRTQKVCNKCVVQRRCFFQMPNGTGIDVYSVNLSEGLFACAAHFCKSRNGLQNQGTATCTWIENKIVGVAYRPRSK